MKTTNVDRNTAKADEIGSPKAKSDSRETTDFRAIAEAKDWDFEKLHAIALAFQERARIKMADAVDTRVFGALAKRHDTWRKLRTSRPFVHPNEPRYGAGHPPSPLGLRRGPIPEELLVFERGRSIFKPIPVGGGFFRAPRTECVYEHSSPGHVGDPTVATSSSQQHASFAQGISRLQAQISPQDWQEEAWATTTYRTHRIQPMMDRPSVHCFTPTLSGLGMLMYAIPPGIDDSRVKIEIQIGMGINAAQVDDPMSHQLSSVNAVSIETAVPGLHLHEVDFTADQFINIATSEGGLGIHYLLNPGQEIDLTVWVTIRANVRNYAMANIDMRSNQDFGVTFSGMSWGTVQQVVNVQQIPNKFEYV